MQESVIRERLAQEHQVLSRLVSGLREATVSRPGESPDERRATLCDRFTHFRAHVTKRFALEEVGGLYDDVLKELPTLSPEVKALRKNQRDILAAIEAVHAALQEGNDPGACELGEIDRRIGEILHAVEEHTEREQLLVSSVFTCDTGGEN